MADQDQFQFSFSGDDIEDSELQPPASSAQPAQQTNTPPAHGPPGAFPVEGRPLLPPILHELEHMLSELPSKIAYSLLTVNLDGNGSIKLPRRELWDVRMQLMAEENADDSAAEGKAEPGLGKHDIKTGTYEGGFKSWESSVDLVKTLALEDSVQMFFQGPCRLIELGCGTALPSLALFAWASAAKAAGASYPLTFTLADYNPTVLYLVTLPNIILTWALLDTDSAAVGAALSSDGEIGELELTPEVIEAFKDYLRSNQVTLSLISGAWSSTFIELLYSLSGKPGSLAPTRRTLVLGAETIYSPFALNSFVDTILSILLRERNDCPSDQVTAIVAAKRLYFGVGGSLDDFVEKMRALGVTVDILREEEAGVRRGVVCCSIP